MFTVVIGNPPYNNGRDILVWKKFLCITLIYSNYTCMIYPARWLYYRKTLKNIQEDFIGYGLKYFDYYPKSTDLFNVRGIDGGITISLFVKKYHENIIYDINSEKQGIYKLGEKFFSNSYEKEAYQKIFQSSKKTIEDRVIGKVGYLGSFDFGYIKEKHAKYLSENIDNIKNPIKIWANKVFNDKSSRYRWFYIDREILNKTKELSIILSTRKVMIDKKGVSLTDKSKANIFNNIPQIVGKEVTASGDVFFILPEKDTEYDLELIKSYFMTKTIRFLMSITQKELFVHGFENVPDYTYFIPMLNEKLFTDEFFYTNYNFSNELIEHIEKSISEKVDK